MLLTRQLDNGKNNYGANVYIIEICLYLKKYIDLIILSVSVFNNFASSLVSLISLIFGIVVSV